MVYRPWKQPNSYKIKMEQFIPELDVHIINISKKKLMGVGISVGATSRGV